MLAAFVDRDADLGRQVVAAPAKKVEHHSAAHAVISHDAMLQADAPPALKHLVKNERSSAVP
jgi:hypothetical protein